MLLIAFYVLMATSPLMDARFYMNVDNVNFNSNTTISVGYFLQSEPRIAVIGMAIDQAQAHGLLPGYDFQ